ncbi:MAG: amidase family protein [Candidatus Aminicenantaceae bacterium]
MPAKAEVLNKAARDKICPHCDKPLDKEEITCPACGKLYWQPDSLSHAEMVEGETYDDEMGCFPIFLWPLLISLTVTSGLILMGFIIHVFIHFEANQIKVIWILGSVAAGGLVYLITSKIKKRRKNMAHHHSKSKGSAAIWTFIFLFLAAVIFFGGAFALYHFKGGKNITIKDIKAYEKIIGLEFSNNERKMMLNSIQRSPGRYEELRKIDIPNSIPPALLFNPVVPGSRVEEERKPFRYTADESITVPENFEDLAFYPVTALAQLIKTQKISSVQLTGLYLNRLKKYGPLLECVITLTEDLAMKQAKKADEEIAAGNYRGPLHGIPWGAKDLLSTKGIKTTWGAAPYKDQIFDMDATVVKRLEEAGAVLVAKLTMGALAMGDVWFEGRTNNPWNIEQGSSGSSAGSAAATSAGLVGFAIGTETQGSIVSPASRCGVTGLRPTFGRVSRYGAMALSWSMDKIGPLCRTVEDCALVFQAISGPDDKDLTVVDLPFNWDPQLDLKTIRIGYLKSAFDRKPREGNERDKRTIEENKKALDVLRSLGIELIPFDLPDFPTRRISFILTTEAAAAFDELTRSHRDDLLVRQSGNAWPNSFRQARFVPAVEYIQANRARVLLMQKMAEKMEGIDVFIAPRGTTTGLTNLTGHPAVVVPSGFRENGTPTAIIFIGNLFAEAKTLRVAKAFQDATGYHLKHPDLDKLRKEKEE